MGKRRRREKNKIEKRGKECVCVWGNRKKGEEMCVGEVERRGEK